MTEAEVVLVLRAAGCVFAEEEATLLVEVATGDALEALVTRRVAGEPLEQVLGWAEFCGLRLVVEPGVFVPRRRTRLLVREALGLLHPGSVLLDLCCGVGALAAALGDAVPGVRVVASDIDPAAVRCARTNLAGIGEAYEGDLYDALPVDLRGGVDVLVVNAPYVPTDEIAMMPPEARDHEHRVALDGGADGLDLHRRIAAGAGQWLAPRGHLIIETSRRQSPVTQGILGDHGLEARVVTDDDLDATAVVGRP